MLQQGGAEAVGEGGERLAPGCPVRAGNLDLGPDLVHGQFQQLVLVRHVPVQARGPGPQLRAELAHAQRVQPLVVEQFHRGGDDLLAPQPGALRLARFAGPHRGKRLGHGPYFNSLVHRSSLSYAVRVETNDVLEPTESPQRDPRRWWVLVALCLSLLVLMIDGTVLNIAIPPLIRELHATPSDVQWILDAYILVFAGLLLTAGSLSDRFGRRRMLITGLALFGAAASMAVSAAAP